MKIQENILSRYYYARLRRPKLWGWPSLDEAKIIESLYQFDIPVQDFHIDVKEYQDYFEEAGYNTRFPNYYAWNIAEKSLEHFVAQRLLQLNATDVYIDIASEGSPVPEIYHRLYGCVTYAQDLSYTPGVNGNKIGSDAASLPLPDGSLTKMALHCSFEHFEGDSDSGFIREAARVLLVGGKVVIVPLYLASRYTILTDPLVSRNRVSFEPDAVVMAVKGWSNRHGRFYDPLHLSSRVLASAKDTLTFNLMRLSNTRDVSESAYARFVLVGTRIDS